MVILGKRKETGAKQWKHSDKMADESLLLYMYIVQSWKKHIQF